MQEKLRLMEEELEKQEPHGKAKDDYIANYNA
jgi:DNA-binding protein YbaB